MKDILHIIQDFHSAAWVMPRGGTWGYRGGGGGGGGWRVIFFPKFNQILCVSYSHKWHTHRHNYLDPRLLGHWGWSKIKFLNMVMWHIKLKGMGSIPGYTEIF